MGISGWLMELMSGLMEGVGWLISYGRRRRKVEERRKESVLLTGLLM
jgi:hypothetical protein